MALRIGGQVVCGEIINTSANTVHGWLRLREVEQPVSLQLTGNLGPAIAGCHIRFEVCEGSPVFDSHAGDLDISDFAMQQIGPTGTMTVRKVKVPDCSMDEFHRHSKLGEPLPVRWRDSLYLEWFSQNGRVVLELVDPRIEYVEPQSLDMGDEAESHTEAGHDSGTVAGLSTSPHFGENGHAEMHDTADFDEEADDDDGDEADDDPYGLFPEDLQAQLDAEANEADGAIGSVDEDDPFVQQMMLMDRLIENGEDVPVGNIFDPPIKLHVAEVLDDEQVEGALKMLLARLATHGIALDMCEHYTPRTAYKLLMETILKEEGTFPELPQTGFVQHFMTHEFCDACDAEMEQELEDYEHRRQSEGAADEPPDEELPWSDEGE